jgi:mannitol/fructose-specific phosphotransferase system IIA component (Ntr-type)
MQPDQSVDPQTDSVHITELLNPQTVRAQVSAADWEVTVHLAGQLLVESGKIEQRYIESMKRVLQDMGPYAVIAPGIVLLHARPEDGVLEPCFSLITLSTPVPFGHSENDPVDIVLAFGAVDKQAHVRALQQLAELLGDAEALALIRSAPDDQALISTISSRFRSSA